MTIQHPDTDEIFPDAVDLGTPWAKQIDQGNAITCTCVALTNVLETLAHNAGENLQLSPRFLWFYSDKRSLSLESAIETLNRVGVCLEDLHPYALNPWDSSVIGLDDLPSKDAFADAQERGIKLEIASISGTWECMRALANGSPLYIKRWSDWGGEHAECIRGYDRKKGLLVHGSYGVTFWEPWTSLNVKITQIRRVTKTHWPMKVHPEYKAATPPTFEDGVLTIPHLFVAPPFPEQWRKYKNVKVHFGADLTPDNTTIGAAEIPDFGVLWKYANALFNTQHTLTIPVVEVAGQKIFNIRIVGVVPTIVSAEVA